MRFSAVIPILLSAVAFVLSILVLLAGRKAGFLNDVYIIKLDTHNIGNGTINVPTTGVTILDNIADDVVSSVIRSAADELGIHDFYIAEVMGYCEGDLENTGSEGSTKQVVTNCTSRPMFTFDPVTILQKELNDTGTGITLEDIGFPTQDVQSAVNALNVAYKAMFITYCIGIATAGLCFLIGFAGFFTSRLAACFNWLFAFISFLSLGIASGIATAIAVKMRDIINDKLRDISVTASYSPKYLGLTWGAVAAMLIVSIYWCGACFSSRKDKTHTKQYADESALVGDRPTGRKRRFF